MRVMLLSTYYKPDIAANGVLMGYLAEDLASMGHEVTVVTTFPHYGTGQIQERYRGKLFERDRQGSVDVYRVYAYTSGRKDKLASRLLNYATFNALSAVAGSLVGKQDVVLTPSPPLTNGLVADLIGRVRRAPFVYNVQDIYPDVAIRMGMMRDRRVIAFFRWMERYVYRRAAALAVIDQFRVTRIGLSPLQLGFGNEPQGESVQSGVVHPGPVLPSHQLVPAGFRL